MIRFGFPVLNGFLAVCLGSCASLEYLHDPQFGFVSREQLPKFLKSVRCELVTFYDANRRRSKLYAATVMADPKLAAERYSYFPLKDELFGLFFVDLKVRGYNQKPSLPMSSSTICRLKKERAPRTLPNKWARVHRLRLCRAESPISSRGFRQSGSKRRECRQGNKLRPHPSIWTEAPDISSDHSRYPHRHLCRSNKVQWLV
jgi:hypothetical protein